MATQYKYKKYKNTNYTRKVPMLVIGINKYSASLLLYRAHVIVI